jgi:hypothetical protein
LARTSAARPAGGWPLLRGERFRDAPAANEITARTRKTAKATFATGPEEPTTPPEAQEGGAQGDEEEHDPEL